MSDRFSARRKAAATSDNGRELPWLRDPQTGIEAIIFGARKRTLIHIEGNSKTSPGDLLEHQQREEANEEEGAD